MNFITNEKDYFISSPVLFVDNNQQKTLSIPIRNPNNHNIGEHISKSWSGYGYLDKHKKDRRNNSSSGDENSYTRKNYSISPRIESPNDDNLYTRKNKWNRNDTDIFCKPSNNIDFKPYDAITNCKSAGIIPYTIHNGVLYFLLQQGQCPLRKKDSGWNDFGGKRIGTTETTAETAAREFSEETSCLFYLKEHITSTSNNYYNMLRENNDLEYDDTAVKILKRLIPMSQKYYADKITEFVLPIYISSKETYISYFVKVDYIPESDLPRAEDIHIPYEIRYIRTCKWFTVDELISLNEKDFHKRLQITRIQQRIRNYYDKGLFC